MQREEFESLTGFRPTLSMYSVIEQEYMESEQDKKEFCREYVKNIDGIAEKIQRLADMAEISRQQEIAELQKQLDKELEWKYCEEVGTHMNQEDYTEMFEVCCTMSDEEATQLLSEKFGFIPEKIKIRHEVQEFERNKYGVYRVKKTFQRSPIYFDYECNYTRFDCAGRQWELIDGDLISYDRRKTKEIVRSLSLQQLQIEITEQCRAIADTGIHATLDDLEVLMTKWKELKQERG
ncbi:MAG: hypothetical protein K2H89_09820 [Oscillospiraceae bacterium]|nr:hypothetical protein [Oscillospiraceae bacterium]